MLGFQTLEWIVQRLVLGHWMTKAKDMEQHCQLNEFAVAFAYNCIPHHLQHHVCLPAYKQLMILHMLAILVLVALPLVCALLWQIYHCPPLSPMLLEIVPFRNNQLRLSIDHKTNLIVDRHKHSFTVEVRLYRGQFCYPNILELPI